MNSAFIKQAVEQAVKTFVTAFLGAWVAAGSDFEFYDYSGTAGTRLIIKQGGNVGIGLSNPSAKLEVNPAADSYFTGGLRVNRSNDGQQYGTVTCDGNLVLTSVETAIGAPVIAFRTSTNGTTSTERARIPSTGGIQSVNSISVGNATPSTSGAGITFPASDSASSNANTLDDYEEGTWNPNQGAGLTVIGTYSSSGTYTKIGRTVTIRTKQGGSTSIAVSAVGLLCTNLPFAGQSGFDGVIGGITNNSYDVFVGTANTAGGTLYYATSAIVANPAIHSTATYTV